MVRSRTGSMNHHLLLRFCSWLLLPLLLLFALYVQAHGDYSPGGGFQAGVIFASALILYGLFFGTANLVKVLPLPWLRAAMAIGLLLYLLTGLLGILLGGDFLDYGVLPGGQHIGILLVELGVGLTVAATMTLFFCLFAEP